MDERTVSDEGGIRYDFRNVTLDVSRTVTVHADVANASNWIDGDTIGVLLAVFLRVSASPFSTIFEH